MPDLSPPELVSAAHFHQAAGHHPRPQPIQPGTELIELVTGGRGWIRHDEAWVEVRPGDLIWQCAGDQTIARSDFANPYRCLAIRFAISNAGRPVPRCCHWDDLDEVRAFTREVVRLFHHGSFDRRILSAYAYHRLRFQAELSLRRARRGALPAGLAQVLELIDARYASDLSLAELAATAGWSQAHLHHQFRQYLETSPHAHLLQRRLRAARELLASSNQPIASVGAACGFADAAGFSRSFRQNVGLTPKAYRLYHAPGAQA